MLTCNRLLLCGRAAEFHACEVRGMMGRNKQSLLILENVAKLLDVGFYIVETERFSAPR